MKFFYAPGACSMGIHTVLEKIGKPYEAIKVALRGEPAERAALDAVNPKGKVPTVQRDDGTVVTEYPVIAHFLATASPEADLWPKDADAALRGASAMDFCVSTIHMQGFARMFRPSNYAPSEADHDKVKAQGKGIMDKGYGIMADQLGSNDWIAGPYSVADSALFYVEYWGAKRLKLALPPALSAHLDRMMARPAVQRMMAAEGLQA